jgi:hypothetical protein
MSEDNGGPAFGEFEMVGEVACRSGGMTLRDYFAAKAMQSLTGRYACIEVVRAAYEHADAMLWERSK